MDFRGPASPAPPASRDIPLFSPTSVLVNLDCSAVQHQRCLVHQIPLDQGCKDIFPYSGFCPGPKPAVYALLWAEWLQQIPHGIPMFSQHGIALSIARLLLPGRPPCGFLSCGNLSLILFHCFSFISCLFMFPFYYIIVFHTIPRF